MQVMDEQLDEARASLEASLRLLPVGADKQRRAVLTYLVPVHMLHGHMPREDALHHLGLGYYAPIVAAIKQGHPGRLTDAIAAEERRFMRVRTQANIGPAITRSLWRAAAWHLSCCHCVCWSGACYTIASLVPPFPH